VIKRIKKQCFFTNKNEGKAIFMKTILKASLIFTVCFSILLTGCGNSGKLNNNGSSSAVPNITNQQSKSSEAAPQISSSKENTQKITNTGTIAPDTGTIISGTTPQTNQTLRFVVLADSRGSDNGVNSDVVNKIMTKIKQISPQPEFAIMPGDLVDGATDYANVKSQLEYFKEIVTKYYPSEFFYPGVGNHEVNNDVNGEQAQGEVFGTFKATFLNGYNRSVYYFDKGGSRFFMLNTDHPGNISSISQTQLNWVQENINPYSKHNLYFFHEPAYPTGPHIGSSLDSDPLQRDRLWQLIDQSINPIVFCGHEHFYTRRHINADFNESIQGINFKFTKNVYQVTVGSFGAPLYTEFADKEDVDVPPISQYHFAVVDINDNKIKTTVYNVEGNVIDSFEQ
jgi:3',5'-cyclic-AMP phosphodiesterase